MVQAMDLKVGETQDLLVWAFPKTLEVLQDAMLGRIASNPTPVEFPISCVGAKPQVEVRLDLPPPPNTPTAAADAAVSAAAPAPEPAKAAEAKPAAPAAAAAGKAGAKKGPAAPEGPLTPRSKVSILLHPCLTLLLRDEMLGDAASVPGSAFPG